MSMDNLSYPQLKSLVAHRNADQVLSKAMAKLLAGAGFVPSFQALENLRSQNVENCIAALNALGINEEGMGTRIAQDFAESFAHYWPEEDKQLQRHFDYLYYVRTGKAVA